jgi:CBS domain-containing protein
MKSTIADIMTDAVLSLEIDSNMQQVHQMMKKNQIRHVPILQDGLFFGVITQKTILAKVMYLLDKYGVNILERKEKSISAIELVDKDIVFAKHNMPLIDAAKFFLSNRHGCLPVVNEDNTLLGIVTSSDFVKLSLKLLEAENE